MNRTEAERLAAMGNALRPDWPRPSLLTLILRDLADRAFRDAAVALAWIAADTRNDGTWASLTPARVREDGPWWTIGTRAPERAPSYPPIAAVLPPNPPPLTDAGRQAIATAKASAAAARYGRIA